MLTLPNKYKYAAKTGQTERIWLFQLYYGTGSSFLPMATKDITVGGVFYPGIVIDPGVVQEKVDLIKCLASVGDLEFICENVYRNKQLSQELFGGSNNYINRNVNVYIGAVTSSTLSDYLLAYQGRFERVQQSGNQLSIYTRHRKPTDKINILDALTGRSTFVPVVYGQYNIQTTDYWHYDNDVFPVPYEETKNVFANIILNNTATTTYDHLLYYDKSLDRFLRLDELLTVIHNTGTYKYTYAHKNIMRTVNIRPETVYTTTNQWTSAANAWDYDSSTLIGNTVSSARHPATGEWTSSGIDEYLYHLVGTDVTYPDGKAFTLKVYGNVEVHITEFENYSGLAHLSIVSYFWDTIQDGQLIKGNSVGTSTSTAASLTITSSLISNDYQWPDYYALIGWWYSREVSNYPDPSDYDIVTGHVVVKDTYLQAQIREDYTNEAAAAEQKWADMDFLYYYGSGYASGIQYPHDIFRDMLERFAGLTFADTQLDNWSTLDTARSQAAWKCRWWTNESLALDKTLEKLQLEGCFAFLFKPDGGRFIYVFDDYDSTDVSATITDNDMFVDDVEISHTLTSSITAGFRLNFRKHAAKDSTYRELDTITSPSATTWNAGVKEKIATYNLDFLVSHELGTYTNDSFGDYQGFLQFDPRITVNTTLINPAFENLELGDIIKFNLSKFNPFGKDWADIYFMLTGIERNIDGMKIIAEEVYSV
jgi:hypothetical protein